MSKSRNILIVVNPAAGKSSHKKKLKYLLEKFIENQCSHELYYTTQGAKTELEELIDGNPTIDEVFVMGGDGTLNYVVNEIQGKSLPISIVSNGTGNDSVKSLHGELNFKKQVEIAIHGTIRKFDLGSCNGRYFVNGVGIGFDGAVVKNMVERGSKKGGHLDYLWTVLRIIAGFKEKDIHFSMDGTFFKRKILLMTISNGTTFGGGFIINPFARTNDGFLDICIFNELRPIMRFWHLPKLKTGAHHKIKETEFHLTTNLKIESTSELVAHLDGEYIGHPPFDISVVKEALLIRGPSWIS